MGVVVVIDPGHGGENLGGNTEEFIEKELTMKVARYMRERLSQYDGVEVYLTHENTEDPDLSREDRAAVAQMHNADFMFSIHFNMSADHNLYGSEVWTSAFGEYYSKGQEFARIEMEGLTGLGFYDRGIKTRLGKDGDDYYGAILHAKKVGVPAVIIEHCHMDEDRDADYLRSHGEDAYKTFGYLDADAVAKYFHLSSAALGVDYSNYSYSSIPVPTTVMGPDLTPADTCSVELIDSDTEAGTARIRITAKDAESKMLYYSLSYDGGESFGKVWPWNEDKEALKPVDDDSITVEVELKDNTTSDLVVKVYNRFDRKADSNVITLPAKEIKKEEESTGAEEASDLSEDGTESSQDMTDVSESGKRGFKDYFSDRNDTESYTEVDIELPGTHKSNSGTVLFIAAASIMLVALATLGYIVYLNTMRRKRRRKKRRSSHPHERFDEIS